MTSGAKIFKWISLSSFVLVFLFQLFNLNYPGINGDEAFYSLILNEVKNLFELHQFNLTPIVPYCGPLDFWIFGSVYGLTANFPSLTPGVWMVRIVPLLLYLPAAVILFRELKKWSEELGHWFLFTQGIVPMVLVYTRFAWPQSLVLATFFFLIAEAFRILRTKEVRWYRCALAAGIAIDSHTIAFIGILFVFLPTLKILYQQSIKHFHHAITSIVLLLVIAFPVLRNFPPPTESGEGRSSFFLQLRSLFNIITGIQPFELLLGTDPAPTFLLIIFGLFIIYSSINQFREIKRSDNYLDQTLLAFWVTHFLGSLFILVMCAKGRSLKLPGTERYFLSLIPGWTLLEADSLRRIITNKIKNPRMSLILILALFFFTFGRFSSVIFSARHEIDPNLLATQWLEKECPREKCIVFAENFWNYWPIHFYSRYRLDVNFIHYSWKSLPPIPINGREIAGCWFEDSEIKYEGPFRAEFKIPAQKRMRGQICKIGISSPK